MVFDVARGTVPTNAVGVPFSRRRVLRLATVAAVFTPVISARRPAVAGAAAEDISTRKEIYDELQPLLAEHAPLLWTYSGTITDAVSSRLNGYVILPNESRASMRSS